MTAWIFRASSMFPSSPSVIPSRKTSPSRFTQAGTMANGSSGRNCGYITSWTRPLPVLLQYRWKPFRLTRRVMPTGCLPLATATMTNWSIPCVSMMRADGLTKPFRWGCASMAAMSVLNPRARFLRWARVRIGPRFQTFPSMAGRLPSMGTMCLWGIWSMCLEGKCLSTRMGRSRQPPYFNPAIMWLEFRCASPAKARAWKSNARYQFRPATGFMSALPMSRLASALAGTASC